MPKIHISTNPKQKICATRHNLFQYVQWSRSVIQACCTRVGNAARLFHDNSHIKGLRGICPGNACSWDTCGTPGERTKLLSAHLKTKLTLHPGLIKWPTGLQLMRYYHDTESYISNFQGTVSGDNKLEINRNKILKLTNQSWENFLYFYPLLCNRTPYFSRF
jgi:hypothetical protein